MVFVRFTIGGSCRSCKNLIGMANVEEMNELERTMPKRISRAGKIFALACIPLVFLAVYYAPMLTSLGWHLVHGKAIDYRGLRVEVPWGWTADLSLMKE